MAEPQKETKADLAAARMLEQEKADRERMERERIMTTATTDAAAARASMATPERPVPGVVVPPGTERVTPMKPYGTVDERARMHAEDPSTHPDWETQPQINAPQDVGVPTPEGQADAARIRAGQRRSDVAKEPRLERRGAEVTTPMASSARQDVTDERSTTQKMKDEAYKAKETTKEKAHEVKEDVDRKI